MDYQSKKFAIYILPQTSMRFRYFRDVVPFCFYPNCAWKTYAVFWPLQIDTRITFFRHMSIIFSVFIQVKFSVHLSGKISWLTILHFGRKPWLKYAWKSHHICLIWKTYYNFFNVCIFHIFELYFIPQINYFWIYYFKTIITLIYDHSSF